MAGVAMIRVMVGIKKMTMVLDRETKMITVLDRITKMIIKDQEGMIMTNVSNSYVIG
jgi:hypothetical protein